MAIKMHFDTDNFSERRANSIGAGNAFDPESLITGYEIERGFTFTNSHRDYPGQHTYDAIVRGEVPMAIVHLVAPRVLNQPRVEDAAFLVRTFVTALYSGMEERSI